MQQWALTECISASQNCTIEGEGYMLELIINGVQYKSISAAAKALGLNVCLLSRRVNGIETYEKIDQPPVRSHSTRAIPITINGKSFKSISEAARFYDVNYPSFFLTIKKALETGEDDLFIQECERTIRSGKQVTIEGKTYNSWTEAARDLGVCYSTFVSRMKRGYYDEKPKETVCHKGTPVIANGTWYQSRKACAEAYGIKPHKLSTRLMNGADIETALDDEKYREFVRAKEIKNAGIYDPMGEMKVHAFGRGFHSYAECARAFGLLPSELTRRIKDYHLTVEQAVDEEVYRELSGKIKDERKRIKKLQKLGLYATEVANF